MSDNLERIRKQLEEEITAEGSRPAEPSNVQADNASAYSDTKKERKSETPVDGFKFLRSFMNATPFFDLFEYIADHHYKSTVTRVNALRLKSLHKWFFYTCIVSDYIARFAVVSLLLYIAGKSAIKLID